MEWSVMRACWNAHISLASACTSLVKIHPPLPMAVCCSSLYLASWIKLLGFNKVIAFPDFFNRSLVVPPRLSKHVKDRRTAYFAKTGATCNATGAYYSPGCKRVIAEAEKAGTQNRLSRRPS